jgi:hypothetical protein
MIRRPVAIIAVLLSFAILPQLLFVNADAKGPIHNYEHELGQFMRLMIAPMGIAIVILGVWAMRARRNQIMAK